MNTIETPADFLPLSGIYEPSAIHQLTDGRFLIVEDEKEHPFCLLAFRPDGSLHRTPLQPGLLQGFAAFWKLDDLEGLTGDAAGNLYAITSHSRDGDGEEKKARDKLVRFRIDGERVVDSVVVKSLKPALTAAHPVLAAAAQIRDVKTAGGLNIEALEISPDQQRLLLGLRSPLLDGRAIVASVDNLAATFDHGAAPRISTALQTLDLGGHGIRGLSWLASLGGYLLISGPVARDRAAFQLWFWTGEPAAPARRVTVPGRSGFEHSEGVSAALINGRQHIILVSDDGDRKLGRSARFLLLDPGQLQIAC